MDELSWSSLALSDGQEWISESGDIRVIRLVDGGLRLEDPDLSTSRYSLRWMLFHHVRQLLRSHHEMRSELVDWPAPFASPLSASLSDTPPESLRYPFGPVSLSFKAKKSKPVLGRDFSPLGLVDREPLFRVMTCHQSMGRDVEVWRDVRRDGRALFHQVVKCSDYWRCPVCSHRIVMARRQQLSDIFDAVAGPGQGAAYLVTFTVPHSRTDRLEDLLRQMLYARDRLHISGWGKRLHRPPGATLKTKNRLGDLFIGSMRSLEFTWSAANGWHPHLHEMWVFESEIPQRRQGLFAELPDAWADACEDWWLQRPNSRGADVRRIYSNAEYLAKFECDSRNWGAQYELAAGQGKGRSIGPWALLEASMYGDPVHRAAFLEYAHALRAVSPSSIHVGGRLAYAIKQLGLTADDDSELAQRLGDDAELLTTLSPGDFRVISQHRAFDTYLRLVQSAGCEAALSWVESLKAKNPAESLT